jgi:hypothetical protein
MPEVVVLSPRPSPKEREPERNVIAGRYIGIVSVRPHPRPLSEGEGSKTSVIERYYELAVFIDVVVCPLPSPSPKERGARTGSMYTSGVEPTNSQIHR